MHSAVCALGEKHGVFRPVSLDGQANRGKYFVPIHWTAGIGTQSKNSDNESEQNNFHIENARLPSRIVVFAWWPYAWPMVAGLQGLRKHPHRHHPPELGPIQTTRVEF